MVSVDGQQVAQNAAGPRATPLRPRQLIGREREFSEVRESVVSTPVTTLTGPGGVGKTALATSVAAASCADFPDGVIVVWLGSLRSAELVVSEVAAQAGLPKSGGESLEDALVHWLAERDVLLCPLGDFADPTNRAPKLALAQRSEQPRGGEWYVIPAANQRARAEKTARAPIHSETEP